MVLRELGAHLAFTQSSEHASDVWQSPFQRRRSVDQGPRAQFGVGNELPGHVSIWSVRNRPDMQETADSPSRYGTPSLPHRRHDKVRFAAFIRRHNERKSNSADSKEVMFDDNRMTGAVRFFVGVLIASFVCIVVALGLSFIWNMRLSSC